MKQKNVFASTFKTAITASAILMLTNAEAQNTLPLTDLSSFQTPGANWKIAGDVRANIAETNVLTISAGTGILVNMPEKNSHGQDLISNFQHGDLDLEFDYMMAKGSNSGVYMQGRYEIQLFDSWGSRTARAGDNGGIYERWDDSKPDGQKGYEGHPPRMNASRAPGVWQHMKISFQAPRFDASGKKTENARILRVELNGVTIHENVELSGVTRGSISPEETAKGPIRIQGDHGPVAFRNVQVSNYDKPRPELSNLRYTVYKGKFEAEPDYKKLPPEAEGSSVILTSSVNNKLDNEFLIRYTGTIKVVEPGEYRFNMNVPGGGGVLRINNQVAIPLSEWRGVGKVTLPAGNLPFELIYSKVVDWAKPSIGLAVAGPGIREYLISDAAAASGDPVDPILVDAPTNTILRSFMDIPGGPRVTHAISVGSPDKVHYTYDMDNAMLVQVWRGSFLDATPMWHDRGDGSSRPIGAVQRFGKPVLSFAKLSSPQDAWIKDTTATGYRPKGYILDEMDRPTFRYIVYGSTVSDAIRVLDGGQGIRRDITIQNGTGNLYMKIAEGKTIESVSNGLYLVDDKAYFLRIDDAGGASPVIRDANGRKEMIIPVQSKISYSILF